MSWTIELIRILFVVLGVLEAIPNFIYLLRKDGVELARKQHGELPKDTTRKQIRIKTVCMFLFGVSFLGTVLFSYATSTYHVLSFAIVMGAFSTYLAIEATYYKYWRIFVPFIISVILFFVILFVTH
ncbi:hypothetical protein HQ697_08610 [Enterococcus faecium]|uniref:hypothetical protein n=1 Tax=Listeria monocytogenes TaxID=1639 RepID=UPI0015717A27|nr:hypothetical protein [Enterococcus faecium]HAB9279726.1 hypothetical protein [Listeria monocytogenes]NTM26041.1 hypothetical protein [Enterococcus faecium]HDT9925451.1 hypothetical protein [Listeria monocytogenes]HEL8589915.1 hypothetical protein [Listeria monocytogenes]